MVALCAICHSRSRGCPWSGRFGRMVDRHRSFALCDSGLSAIENEYCRGISLLRCRARVLVLEETTNLPSGGRVSLGDNGDGFGGGDFGRAFSDLEPWNR